MHKKILVDYISSFSPPREDWVSRPAEDLPEEVTISFERGETGVLDLKSPRTVHWANLLDQFKRANKPVYVEIDEETSVITSLLIPEVCKVQSLETDERGDIRVKLIPSAAIHFLLKTDPNFDAMRESLQSALGDGSERLITETRDEHEIIDVRMPIETPEGESEPVPAPPEDPPVSPARAQELHNTMGAETCDPCSPSSDCIPFKYPDDGCWARAHKMCHMMVNDEGEDPEKVWIDGSLTTSTPNHPDCHVHWGWHVAPTLTLNTAGNPKTVIDPALSSTHESKEDWKNRQGDPSATLRDSAWTEYWGVGTTDPGLTDTNYYLSVYRSRLQDRCIQFGPPPYSCTQNCFFIIDRNTFSDDEIEAMLVGGSPATIEAAFYIVVDGFSPYDLGFTNATMQHTPNLNISPNIPGMSIEAERMEFEFPTHLNRRQRLTWVYRISFTNTTGFTVERRTVRLEASISTVSSIGRLYLIQQPNPYEIDGETSWLSTDLRVFQIRSGESKFNVNMGSNPSTFITQVISNLNSGSTGGQTFESDISTNQQTSRLELSERVGGTRVYNFAVAKVRYRAVATSATDVRVFFRLFPVATTSLAYNQATSYRRHTDGGRVIPLLGIGNNEVIAIPCFAAPRINSASASMTTQTDPANVQTMPPDAGGAEVIRYFGCWLDINQTQPQFPIQPSPTDGPYASGRRTIQELIRNEHQCLVSEIAFTPAPAQSGSTPSISDKLAQRNLAIVESANPGVISSRRIPQTFEIQPSSAKLDHDELMIDWGDVPVGSQATLYLPGVDSNDILQLAARKYRSYRLLRIDEHTLKFPTGGITYLPIPFTDKILPGLLTVDLPEGIEKGQSFTIVVRQITGQQQQMRALRLSTAARPNLRYIVGSFQLTIPVREKAEILPGQERLLSNLRWIERAIPTNNRWSLVFSRYVKQIADRVDALGGNSKKVGASPSGEWRTAYRKCFILAWATALFTAMLVVGIGVLSAESMTVISTPVIIIILVGLIYLWLKNCKPRLCQLIRMLVIGIGLGAVILGILLILGISSMRLITTLAVSAGVAAIVGILAWLKGCFR